MVKQRVDLFAQMGNKNCKESRGSMLVSLLVNFIKGQDEGVLYFLFMDSFTVFCVDKQHNDTRFTGSAKCFSEDDFFHLLLILSYIR